MRPRTRSSGIVALFALALLSLPGAGSASTERDCMTSSDPRVRAMSDDGIGLTSSLGLAAGRYALPETQAPSHLVVMFHGHGNDSCSWRNHLRAAASRGAVAFAMDYIDRSNPVENYGWRMREAAEQSIEAARHFLGVYSSIENVYAFGISMGGNAAGVAVASVDAKRPNGAPLFDYLIDVEGVNNLIEEYLVARAVAPVNATAAIAQQEIEEENGGALEEAPEAYAESTNVLRAQDMVALDGAIVVNGLDDGLVPTDQTPQMTVALTAAGVPAHQYTVVLRGDGEAGTTGTGIVAGPLFAAVGQTYESPLAGHGWEGSDTHLVIKTGFERLWALIDGGTVAAGVTVVPGA